MPKIVCVGGVGVVDDAWGVFLVYIQLQRREVGFEGRKKSIEDIVYNRLSLTSISGVCLCLQKPKRKVWENSLDCSLCSCMIPRIFVGLERKPWQTEFRQCEVRRRLIPKNRENNWKLSSDIKPLSSKWNEMILRKNPLRPTGQNNHTFSRILQ